MSWIVPKLWENGECFIVGGGASIIKQFNIPEDLADAVIQNKSSPAVYSSYLSAIHDKHVIGVNQAFRLGNWIDFVIFGDKGFFLKNQEDLAKLTNIRIGIPAYFNGRVDWVKYLAKDLKKTSGLSTTPSKVTWNGNTGAAAINLAVHLGVKRIILLGFDMNVDEKGRQWWHQLYKQRDLKRGLKAFTRHSDAFPEIASDAIKLGVEILNANPDSNINCFRKVNIKECL